MRTYKVPEWYNYLTGRRRGPDDPTPEQLNRMFLPHLMPPHKEGDPTPGGIVEKVKRRRRKKSARK